MNKCYHTTDQELIFMEKGSLFTLSVYECGECGEEYIWIEDI